MHRSGTSALSRVLNLLGCFLPEGLVQGDVFNERGYWEVQAIADLNERILNGFGQDWYAWEALPADVLASPVYDVLGAHAERLTATLFGGQSLILLKDPRISRLLPVWENLLTKGGFEPHVVCAVRSPAEVAASLLRRNGANPSVSQLVWLRYMLDAERDSRHLPRTFQTYSGLLADWRACVARLSAQMGFEFPARSARVEVDIDAFLTGGLRHHVEATDSSAAAPVYSDWVRSAYAILLKWAEQGEDVSDHAALDELRNAFDAATQTFARPIFEQAKHGHSLYLQLEEARSIGAKLEQAELLLSQRTQELGEAIEKRDELDAACRQNAEDAAARNQQAADYDERVQDLLAKLAESGAVASDLESKIASQAGLLQARVAQAEKVAAEKGELSDQLREVHGRLAASEASLNEKSVLLGEVQRLLKHAQSERSRAVKATLEQMAGKLSRKNERLKAQAKAMKVLSAHHEATKRRLADTEASLQTKIAAGEQAEASLREIQQSTSWKVTRPLRTLLTKARPLLTSTPPAADRKL